MNDTQQIETTTLPEAIRGFLADSAGDARPSTITFFADNARVDDQGETFTGVAEVEAWLKRTTGMFVYTLQITSASNRGDGVYAVLNHLESDAFPGGEANPTFVFTVTDDKISHLTFE
ncbi:hypothetical protein ABCS02_17340 [Microbacterium sp. X-17]|uniref:hypothetical protein n=1 Tax=Microbacterium sp. X-17 TaxID=3144404 RepID=UPI0031F53440